MTQPPAPAVQGHEYFLYFNFTDYESGALVDPISVSLDITYGEQVGLTADYAGPFAYQGASAPAAGTIWRTGTGQYAFLWDVPLSALPGVYVANWTSIYGTTSDSFLAVENFSIAGGGPYLPVPSGDVGFWSGSLTYSPAWAAQPFTIPLGGTDANGVTWAWQSVQGWDSPPVAGSVIQRSADQGGWPAPQFYGPRIITLTVMASAPTQLLRDQARAQMQQIVPPNDLAVLQFNEPIPKLAYVRRNASASITEACPTLTDVIFTIPMVAPDPRKYATTPQVPQIIVPPPIINPLALPFALPVNFPGAVPASATAITAVNIGNFETRPDITVTGPITSPVIVNAATGQQITFTGLTLAGSDQLTLDTDNRQSFLNGNFYPADVSSAWWVLEPGQTQVFLDGITTGGASLTISYSSAWI